MPLPLTPTGGVAAALTHVGGIKLLRSTKAKDDCLAYASEVLGGLDFGDYQPADNDKPAFFYGRLAANAVLWIDGMSNLAQATKLISGYVGGISDSIAQPFNQHLQTCGAQIFQRINAVDTIATQVFMGGWSMGGAIAMQLIGNLRSAQFLDNGFAATTFGAPRVGGPPACALIRVFDTELRRWMTDTDPIPLIPPRFEDFPPILPLFGLRGVRRAGNFLHPCGGVALFPNGDIESDFVPPGGFIRFAGAMGDWALAQDNDPTNSHWIGEYERRLLLQKNAHPHGRVIPQGPAEQVDAEERRRVNRASSNVVASINILGRQQAQGDPVIPPDKAFTYYRLGKIYTVYFGDQPVFTSNTKRRARTVTNFGNEFLKRMQAQAVVDPVTLLQQFQLYLESAVKVDGGFTPVMNVTFPVIGEDD